MLGWFLQSVFLGRAQRKLCERGLSIFAWHKIAEAPAGTRDPFLYDPPRRFAAQLTGLQTFGFGSVSLSEFVNPPSTVARKVVLTFDDGCANVLENGLQTLASHGMTAIQFLVPGLLGRTNEWDIEKGDVPERLMDAAQVRHWLAAGQEIGSHSMTHRNLRHLPDKQAREEIAGSKKALEDLFAVEVRHFSYPFGSWNPAVRDLVQEAGYQTACTMDFGVNSTGTNSFELRRMFPLSATELVNKARHRALRRFKGQAKRG